ncbi:uncharacterized protein NPIL_82101 [Nephila pilipes]|uniref:Gustatory receptor n=1 Tax=Nephila pilipes TaxID=299642 RepID=A0A8X6QVE3_NEPPI|nr:uncharacterized protein NPIL_82101 [Nephila pilipes]
MTKIKRFSHSGLYDPFKSIIKIMFICGLDITIVSGIKNIKSSSGFKFIYQKFVAKIWMIFIFYTIGSIVTVDIFAINLESVNRKIARRSVDIAAFLIWSIMNVKRNDLFILLQEVQNLLNMKNKEIPKVWILTGTVIILMVPFTAWMTMTVPFQDEIDCKLIVKYYSFGFDYVKDGNNCYVLVILTFFQKFSVYTLRTAVTVNYIIICLSLRNVLKTHSELGAKMVADPITKVDYAIFKTYLQTHDRIESVLKSFEKTMSLPIFLIASSDFMSVMNGFARMDSINNLPGYKLHIAKFATTVIFISLRGIVSFLCISLAASDVYEASKYARDVQKDMLKRILRSEEKIDIRELVYLSMLHNTPPFILSAWGVFNFTKGLFLSAFGSILTYSLLIMHILK